MLRLTDLQVGYGAFTAVHGLNLTVAQGDVLALLGANGAGKSSTLMALAGHVEVQAGRIELEGRDITALPAARRAAAGLAIAPEGRRLFPDLSVAENLTIGGYAQPRSDDIRNRRQVFEIFPRLAEREAQRAGTLSGGEQQMLAIGRALMARPRLLMIDELSLGLMPAVIDICYRALAQLKDLGLTIVLVEQNTRRALEVADKVCVLESGRETWQGTAAEARADPAMIEARMGLSAEAAST